MKTKRMTRRFACLVWANMLTNGQKFMVVQVPDYRGGHQFSVAAMSYELRDFEYIAWIGTPAEYAEEQPTFVAHYEPLHEEPEDVEIIAPEILRPYIKRNISILR